MDSQDAIAIYKRKLSKAKAKKRIGGMVLSHSEEMALEGLLFAIFCIPYEYLEALIGSTKEDEIVSDVITRLIKDNIVDK